MITHETDNAVVIAELHQTKPVAVNYQTSSFSVDGNDIFAHIALKDVIGQVVLVHIGFSRCHCVFGLQVKSLMPTEFSEIIGGAGTPCPVDREYVNEQACPFEKFVCLVPSDTDAPKSGVRAVLPKRTVLLSVKRSRSTAPIDLVFVL